MKPFGTNSPGRFESFGARNRASPSVTLLRKAQGERIIKQPSAIARLVNIQRLIFREKKNKPPNTSAAAISKIGVSGRNKVPAPTTNPAPNAVYSTLLRRCKREFSRRKPGCLTRRNARTRTQQASPVQKTASTSVSGTAV